MRPYRILQKRGVFVDGDDFLGVTDTYPKHPISEKMPKLTTKTELTDFRKGIEREDIRQKKHAMDTRVQSIQKA
jgi:hypothetical protein